MERTQRTTCTGEQGTYSPPGFKNQIYMDENISIAEYSDADFHGLVRMSQRLFKDYEEPELVKLLNHVQNTGNYKIWLAKQGNERYVGFAVFSIRTDHVEGSDSFLTGYIESIYIEPDFRKKGVSRTIVQKGEEWCKSKGCKFIGSDTWLNDTNSRNFHKKLGFKEEEELVHFIKRLN